jgi:thiamine biosynthesis protein ThiS
MARVLVNGRERELEAGATVASLLASAGLEPKAVAVELNGRILARGEFGSCRIGGGDRLEIVRFVGGG